MCNFFSAIVTKDKVLWDSLIDSHTELLEKFKIKDDTKEPDFVRVELVPPDYSEKSFKDTSNWKFKTDQDLIPSWYKEADANKRTHEALKDFIADHVAFDGEEKKVYNGRMYAFGSSTVEACGSSTVEARGSSTVVARGSSTVEAFDSSKVEAWGSSTVKAFDSSKVKACDSSKVEACGSSKVEAWGSSTVEAWDSSKVKARDFSIVIWPTKKEVSIPKGYKAINRE